MMRSLLLLTGLAGVAAKDPNLLTDDNTNFGAASLDYDKHGCDKSSGSYWCQLKNRCVSTWESCETLYGYNDQCTARWSGLTWDLSPLKGKAITITDALETSPSYAYAFSLCGNVDLANSELTDSLVSKCAVTQGAAGESMSGDAPAYQVTNGEFCKRAGEDQSGSLKQRFSRGNQMNWALLDPLNPAMGLELTYTGGNTCKQTEFQEAEKCDYQGSDGHTYCSRGFKIRMVCNPDVEYVPTVTDVVEDASCMYTVRINSKYACPTQCPWGANGKVCSGKGLCMFSGYSDDDDEDVDKLAGTATASCACKMGNWDQPHLGPDCGEYNRWGETYDDYYDYLNQRKRFWRRLWVSLFITITACVCVVQRQRVLPVITGVISLVTGGGGGSGGVTYQRVATDAGNASRQTTGMVGASKYTVADLEDEDDDDVGDSAHL